MTKAITFPAKLLKNRLDATGALLCWDTHRAHEAMAADGIKQVLRSTERALVRLLAFGSTWAMFALVYWYVAARQISWRTAGVAATVMAVSYELMKWGFGWYVTSVADYGSAYGNLATIIVLFFWIYYVAVGFVLSGEEAQVYSVRRARKVQGGNALADSA